MNYRVASLLKRICEIRKERGIERAQQLRSISKFNPAWGLRIVMYGWLTSLVSS